jgi:hypothetical protein
MAGCWLHAAAPAVPATAAAVSLYFAASPPLAEVESRQAATPGASFPPLPIRAQGQRPAVLGRLHVCRGGG